MTAIGSGINPNLNIEPATTKQQPAKTNPAQETAKPQEPAQQPSAPKDHAETKAKPSADFSPNGVNFNAKPQAPKGGLDSKAVFTNGNAASPEQIDKILKKYNSPFQGKGQVISDMCKKYNVNPTMMLAIMQQESTFGKASEENKANPFSVHFNHAGKGIMKLRHPDGRKATFEESLEGAIKTMKNRAGDSNTPFTTAGNKYCNPPAPWLKAVTGHYNHLNKVIGQ